MELVPVDEVARIISSVREFCRAKTDSEILSGLFSNKTEESNEFPEYLHDALRNYDQNECLAMVTQNKLAPAQAIVLLIAFYRGTLKETQWIGYNIVHYLGIMCKSGTHEAKTPLALHAFMLLNGFSQNLHACSAAHSALVAALASSAPKEAVKHGLLAAQCGNIRVFLHDQEALCRLNLEVPTGILDLATASILNKALGNPLVLTTNIVSAAEVDSVSFTEVEGERNVLWTEPAGDKFYYLFTQASQPSLKPALSVIKISDALFSVDISKVGMPRFYTFTKGYCVSDLSFGIDPFEVRPYIEIDEPVFVLEDSYSGKANISHFLLDKVPRLLAYKAMQPKGGVVLLCEDQPYYRSVLDDLGINSVVVPGEQRFSIRTPLLFLMSTMFNHFDHPANHALPRTLVELRKAFGVGEKPSGSARILISRADAKGRQVTNWAETEDLFREHGFKSVILSALSFKEQKELFVDAAYVVGVHGAGLTNVLFAPASCRVLEILPPLVASSTYWGTASGIGQRYQAFIADDPEMPRPDYRKWRHNSSNNRRDVRIDIQRLRLALRSFIADDV